MATETERQKANAALTEDLRWARKDLVEAFATGDPREIKDAQDVITDLKAERAIVRGVGPAKVVWSSPTEDGIHSGDRRYQA